MPVLSRKKFIQLLGATSGAAIVPASLSSQSNHAKQLNSKKSLPELPKKRITHISYRYFLPWSPVWGNETFTNQRLEELIAFGHEAGIDSFQFYVNTPWQSYYILPKNVESQENWIKWMRNVVAPRIRGEGFGLELNFQEILGASTGGTDLRSTYDYKQFMVDHHGNTSPGSPCPEDTNYRNEIAKMLKGWASLEPDIFWIDDDFRLHNHSTSGMFCYCPLHLLKFSKLTGKSYTRESLLKEVLQSGKPSETRNKWLTFLGDYMADFAGWVSEKIRNISPNTRVALMISGTDIHSLEGRDWNQLLLKLSPNYRPMVRPTFGLYTGTGSPPKSAASGLLDILSQVQVIEQSMGVNNCDFAPELENTRYTTWAKSVAHSTCSLIMGQLAGIPMITCAVNDLDGSPLSEEPTLIPMFRNARPRMEAIAALELKKVPVRGLLALSDKDVARMSHLKPNADYTAMAPRSRMEDPVFEMGIPFNYATAKVAAESNDPVLLEASSVWKASDQELKGILSKGVLMTAHAAEILAERGFGEYCGVNVKEHHTNNIQSEIYLADKLPGVTAIRVPHRGSDWNILEPTKNSAIASQFLDLYGNLHAGTVLYKNTLGGRIAVYAQNSDMQGGLFGSHARLRWLHGVMAWITNNNFIALPVVPQHGVSLLKTTIDKNVFSYCNLGTDILETFTLRWNKAVSSIKSLQLDGSWVPIDYNKVDDVEGLPSKLEFNCSVGVYDWLVLQIS